MAAANTEQPVRIIEKQGNGIVFHHQVFRNVLSTCGDRPIVIVSIIGKQRTGKSYLLNWCRRHLRHLERMQRVGAQLNDNWWEPEAEWATVQGFVSRPGSDQTTEGVWTWSRPFIVRTTDDREVAVVLLDTEGTDAFDHSIDKFIVYFSIYFSNLVIYNVQGNLNQSDLDFFKLVLDDSLEICTEQGLENVFQELVFLIRDWNESDNEPWGPCALNQLNQRHASTFESIQQVFTRATGFRLPHKGLRIMNEYFREQLGSFFGQLLSRDALGNLNTRRARRSWTREAVLDTFRTLDDSWHKTRLSGEVMNLREVVISDRVSEARVEALSHYGSTGNKEEAIRIFVTHSYYVAANTLWTMGLQRLEEDIRRMEDHSRGTRRTAAVAGVIAGLGIGVTGAVGCQTEIGRQVMTAAYEGIGSAVAAVPQIGALVQLEEARRRTGFQGAGPIGAGVLLGSAAVALAMGDNSQALADLQDAFHNLAVSVLQGGQSQGVA